MRHSAIGAQGVGAANRPAMVGATGARGRAEEKDESTDVEIGEDWLSDEDAVGDGVIR